MGALWAHCGCIVLPLDAGFAGGEQEVSLSIGKRDVLEPCLVQKCVSNAVSVSA